MGTGYLLDTNVIIDFSVERLPVESSVRLSRIIDSSPYISIINKIELLSFSAVPDQIILFTQSAQIISLTDEIVATTINIRKKYKLKLPDAIIAASAIVYDLTLVTHNLSDFKKVEGLQFLDSYELT
jgi:predicted nucleic acid-binding protein